MADLGLPVIAASCVGRHLRLVVIGDAPFRPETGQSYAAEAQDTVAIRCGCDWQSHARATGAPLLAELLAA